MSIDHKEKFTTTLSRFNSDLWHFHVPVPATIGNRFLKSGTKRVLCKVGDLDAFSAALMHDGQGAYFININKERRKKLKIAEGDAVEVELIQDTSKYGMPMPAEMEELLKQDPEGDRFFHSLTPGKQRSLLFLVGKPKTSDTRLKKAYTIIEYLKATGGVLDFKELNEAFKQTDREW